MKESLIRAFKVTAAPKVKTKSEEPDTELSKAKKEAYTHDKNYQVLRNKVDYDAERAAKEAGHEPYDKKGNKNDRYFEVRDHHAAHHKDAKKLADLRQKAAKARTKYKRLQRGTTTASTVEASMTKKEVKDFYHEMKTKHDDAKAKVDKLTKKREDGHKKVSEVFNKMVSDSDKKAHKDAIKAGHKEGSLGYRKAFSEAHMEHLLTHPDNDKHDKLLSEGNKTYGELQRHKSTLKMHKISLKNATKMAKEHGIDITTPKRARKKT